jgi:hypothetical protein
VLYRMDVLAPTGCGSIFSGTEPSFDVIQPATR